MEKKFLYKRIETESEVKIVYNTYYTYVSYVVLTIALLLTVSNTLSSGMFWLLIVLFYLSNSFSLAEINKEIKNAMEEGTMKIEGNRLSHSNPLTITITK